MKYRVKDADAEINRMQNFGDNRLVGKLERTQRWLMVLIGVLVLSLVALAVYTIILVITEQNSPRPCLSEKCVDTASRIIKSLNRDMDPCQDFYEFACGGWIKKNPATELVGRSHQLGKLREKLYVELKELLEEDDEAGLPKSVLKAKVLYRLCMRNENQEDKNNRLIGKFLQLLGLTPHPPVRASKNFSWELTAGRGRRLLNLNMLLKFTVVEDIRNSSRNRIVIEQVSPGIDERYLVDPTRFESVIQKNHKLIVDAISKADPKIDAQKYADDVIEVSKRLAKVITPLEVRRNSNYLFYDLFIAWFIKGKEGFPPEWKQHDWERYLQEVFAGTNVTLRADDRVMVTDLSYLQKVAVLLTKTDPLMIERYLWWYIYRELSYLASLTIQPKDDSSRWRTCMGEVKYDFGVALSYLYVKKHFDQGSQEKAIEMLEDVRAAFAETLEEVKWMDPGTRAEALKKLSAIRNFVGFPSWLFTPEELDKQYDDMEINEESFFETLLTLTQVTVKKYLEKFRETVDKNKWVSNAIAVNAFYSPSLNSITLPAGILQPPFFDNGIEAINYGSIGALMGHEMTHGFDDNGRRFNEDGNVEQWWSATTLEHYHEKVQCIIDQYNQYHMPQLPNFTVDGFNTQGENVADNGGLRSALHAYRRYVTRTPEAGRDVLPGLSSYTPEQLLFLGFAQAWCCNSTIDVLRSKMVSSEHSPNKIRVIGTLSNSEDFARAWKCPAGSAMNPRHKCVLW